MRARPEIQQPVHFLNGGGEMGARMRAYDWAAHPLGLPERWPQALRTAARLMLTTNHPVFIFWGRENYCFYNDAYSASIGPEKHPAMLGAPGREMWGEIWHIIGPQIERVMSGQGATWHEDHLVPIIRNGKLDEVYWTYSYSPIDHADGVGGVLVICSETTKRVVNERAHVEEIAALAQLADMFMQAPSFVSVLDGPEHRFRFVNEAYRRLTGGRDIIGQTVRDALPDIAGQGFYELLDQVYASGERYVGASQRVMLQASPATDAQEHFLDFVYEPVRNSAGDVIGIFVEGYDVTDRARAEASVREREEHIRVLMREVSHRSKNLLSLVQAIARATAAGGVENFTERFGQRLSGLASSYDLLTKADGKSTTIDALVAAQLAHFEDLFGSRVRPDGPATPLSAAAAQALGMALHELGTNASKHGALSNDAGVIDIAWRVERDAEPALIMTWTERGGPHVTPPSRTGFGATVTGALTEASLGAKVEIEYPPEGFCWRMRCSLSALS